LLLLIVLLLHAASLGLLEHQHVHG
jgi:hypothetical protein